MAQWFTIAVWNVSGELVDIAMLQDAREAYRWYATRARMMRTGGNPAIADSWAKLAHTFARVALLRAGGECDWQGPAIFEVTR